MKTIFALAFLCFFTLFFSSCKKKPEKSNNFTPDTSGNQYLYYYIDDQLYEADFNYYDSSWKGGGDIDLMYGLVASVTKIP